MYIYSEIGPLRTVSLYRNRNKKVLQDLLLQSVKKKEFRAGSEVKEAIRRTDFVCILGEKGK